MKATLLIAVYEYDFIFGGGWGRVVGRCEAILIYFMYADIRQDNLMVRVSTLLYARSWDQSLTKVKSRKNLFLPLSSLGTHITRIG